MFGVMIVMLSGVLIGYILRNIRAIPALVSKINIYIIFLLLFVMGLSVGSNPQVIQGLGTLGLLGIAISVVSIAGSVFLSWIVYRRDNRRLLSVLAILSRSVTRNRCHRLRIRILQSIGNFTERACRSRHRYYRSYL